MVQWEAFLKKRSYSGRSKSLPSGSDLPAAPPTLPPSSLASLEARRPATLPRPLHTHPPPPSIRGRGHSGETEGVTRGISSPSSRCSAGEEEGGATGAVALGGVGDSAASSPTGVAVAKSSCSQESLVLAAPSLVASSVCAEHDLPRPVPTHALHGLLPLEVSLLKGVVVPVRSLGGQVTGLASHTLVPQTVRGLMDKGALTVTCHAPLLPVSGLGGPGLRTSTGPVGCARALGVTVCGLDECARVCLAVARSSVISLGHTGLITSHVTALPSPLIVRGLKSGVGSLGGVAGIAWRFQPPGIAATGRGWSLPTRWWAAPLLCPRLPCRTSPGCPSACRGPLRSGTQLGLLCLWLWASMVPECCLALLPL